MLLSTPRFLAILYTCLLLIVNNVSSLIPSLLHPRALLNAQWSQSLRPTAKVIMMTDHRSNSAESSLTNEILRVAEEASRAAGVIILSNMGSEISSTKANSRDLLTVVDPLCEERIREIVLGAFPDHSFLGEEDVLPGKEASAAALDKKLGSNNDGDGRGYLWIVDPIDGALYHYLLLLPLLLSWSPNNLYINLLLIHIFIFQH